MPRGTHRMGTESPISTVERPNVDLERPLAFQYGGRSRRLTPTGARDRCSSDFAHPGPLASLFWREAQGMDQNGDKMLKTAKIPDPAQAAATFTAAATTAGAATPAVATVAACAATKAARAAGHAMDPSLIRTGVVTGPAIAGAEPRRETATMDAPTIALIREEKRPFVVFVVLSVLVFIRKHSCQFDGCSVNRRCGSADSFARFWPSFLPRTPSRIRSRRRQSICGRPAGVFQ